jgi:hypothetical protein
MLTIIISAVAGLLVGSIGVYLLIRYCKSLRQAVVSGATALLLAGGSGLAIYYNGEPVPVVDVIDAKMIDESNGDNYFPDIQVYPGYLAISQLTIIPTGWPEDTTPKAFALIDSQRVTFKKRLRQKLVELKD